MAEAEVDAEWPEVGVAGEDVGGGVADFAASVGVGVDGVKVCVLEFLGFGHVYYYNIFSFERWLAVGRQPVVRRLSAGWLSGIWVERDV